MEIGFAGLSGYAGSLAVRLSAAREWRLALTHKILTGTWDDYLAKPKRCPEDIWNAVKSRFAVCDLARPVLSTICSAVYGGKVTRRIRESVSPVEDIERFMALAGYDTAVVRAFCDAAAYGNGYMVPGWDRRGQPRIAILPPVLTHIVTPLDDAQDVQGVVVHWSGLRRRYTAEGVYEYDGREERLVPGSEYGFIPVVIGAGRVLDASTPYGESLIWPAVQETVQATYLQNDLMVLAKTQSFAVLVVKGSELDSPEERDIGPFHQVRLDPADSGADAKYIAPDAKIADLNEVIDSRFERVAAMCNVPIDLFRQRKAGTEQAAGAAWLTHKPLYDLAVALQKQWKETERRLIAMVDALLLHSATGKPVDYQGVLNAIRVDINFEHEVNPAINQSDAQTWSLLLAEGLVPFAKAYWHFNPEAEREEVEAAERAREAARSVPFGEVRE